MRRPTFVRLLVLLLAGRAEAQPVWTDGDARYAGYPLGDLTVEGLQPAPWDLRDAETLGVLARFTGTDGRPAVLVRAKLAAEASQVHEWLTGELRGVSRGAERVEGFCDAGFAAGTTWAAVACGNVGIEVRVPGDGPDARTVLRAALALLGDAPRGSPPALRVRARVAQGVVRVEAPADARIDYRPRNATLAPVAGGMRLVSVRDGARIDVVAVDRLLRIGRASVCP
jgi:hypothetical protein